MKDLNSQEYSTTMATTTLDRIPTVHFSSDYSCGFPASYSFSRSYPDHTDWGPSRPNPDELTAAIAIAQLSRSKGIATSRALQSGNDVPKNYHSESSRSYGAEEFEKNTWRNNEKKTNNNYDIASTVSIKCEPEEVEEEMVQEEMIPLGFEANMYEERRMNNTYDNRKYVNNKQYSDNGNKRRSASPGEPSSNMGVPRIVLTTTETSNLRQDSPDELSSSLSQSYDSGSMYAMNWVLGNGRDNLFTEKPRLRVSPNTHLSSRRLSPDSRCPSSSSINLPPTRSERISPDSIGYPYYMHAESQPALNTLESYSQENLANNIRPKRRFETPTSFLKRKAQYNVDQARRRCNSDDGGIVRERILAGKFGSLSTIAAYCKQMDCSTSPRLHDNAIDLSISKIVNKTSDDSATTLREDAISKHSNRGTVELAMAFKQFQLNGSKQAVISAAADTTTHRRSSHENNNTYRAAGGLSRNLENSTAVGSETLYDSTGPILYKHVDTVVHPKIALNSELKDHEKDDISVSEANSPSRKSRSPTFQLPDNQLPPKKRRIFDECKDKEVEASYRAISEAPSVFKFSERTSPETLQSSKDNDITNNNQASNEVTRDSILSAVRPDLHGDLPLHIAVVRGMVSVVERLVTLMLKLNIPIDTCNNQKQTALHLAVMTDQPAAVDILLDAGASPALRDLQGDQAPHLAVRHNSPACLRVLLDRCHPSIRQNHRLDLDLDGTNYEGLTPLHLAVQLGHYDLIRLLSRGGAAVDAKEASKGHTALYLALELEDHRAALLLLELGADPTTITHSGSSPVRLAVERYRVDIEELAGANDVLAQ